MPAIEAPHDRFDDLVSRCVRFLSSTTLDGLHEHCVAIRDHLDLPVTRGGLGLYLLNSRVAEAFTRVNPRTPPPLSIPMVLACVSQVVVLKELVLDTLERRYGVILPCLSTRSLHPHEHVIDRKTMELLLPLAEFCQNLGNLLTFAMFDPVCVAVYLSFHILRCKREAIDREGLSMQDSRFFLSRDAHIMAEVSCLFSALLSHPCLSQE